MTRKSIKSASQEGKDKDLRNFQRLADHIAEARFRARPTSDPRIAEEGRGHAVDPNLPRAWRRPAK